MTVAVKWRIVFEGEGPTDAEGRLSLETLQQFTEAWRALCEEHGHTVTEFRIERGDGQAWHEQGFPPSQQGPAHFGGQHSVSVG